MVDIESVDLETGEVLDDMGNIGQVTKWIDRHANECESGEDAVVAFAYCGFKWWAIDLRRFHTVSVH